MLRRLYEWVLHWAETPYGTWALVILAFSESSFFPIPPDVLLIALAVSIPAKSFRYAAICSLSSVLGGILGYLLGYKLMEVAGRPILEFYGVIDKYEYIKVLYHQYDVWAVGIAGFTPIPYKVFTIAAGACEINFPIFILISLLSRSARFFLVGGLIYVFGPSIRSFIERYLNIITIIFIIFLVLGFIAVKWLF